MNSSSLFGGRSRPIMAHLVDSGTLTLDDVREAEQALLKLAEAGEGNEMIPRALLLFAISTCALAAPAFDVASIKPSDPADRRMRVDAMAGGKLTGRSVSLSWLVQFAYHLESYQLSGGPGWMSTSRYDVTARAQDPNANRDQIRQMTQTLLADRFALKLHTESKDLPKFTEWLIATNR